METYFQKGNQAACNSEELPDGMNCPDGGAVEPPVWNSALNNLGKPVTPGVNTLSFITESCTGCHSSAGIWTSWDPAKGTGTKSGQLSGDFSWLLVQKASYAGTGAQPKPLFGKLR
jgi:hypothetical protein